MISQVWIRLRALLRREKIEAEFDEELRYHLQREVERNVARGLSIDAAERTAHMTLGDITLVKEEARQTWSWRRVDEVVQDVRYAFRSLRGQPAFTAMTLLALTIGIGVNTSLFNGFNALLFRPWDVSEPDQVVRLLSKDPRGGYGGLPIASVTHFEQASRTVEGAFAQRSYRLALEGTAGGEGLNAALVSGGFFDVLRVRFVAGRGFTRAEDVAGAPTAVVVLSRAYWKERYGADPRVIGSTIRLEAVPFTIIGVTEAPSGVDQPDLWAPLAAMRLLRPRDANALARLTDLEFCCTDVYARLSRGSTREQAAAELTALFRRLSMGARNDAIGVAVAGTATVDHPEERPRVVRMAAIALAAVGSILLLACANVSNLQLARGTGRQREIAVRLSLGASRGRVIRQLLTESLILAGIGTVASVLLAPVLPRVVMLLRNQRIPEHLDLTPEGAVVGYALAISVLAALAFGVAPAFRNTRISISETLKAYGSRTTGRFRLEGVLVAVQVCVSVALLLGAGLLLRGVSKARSLDPGFRTEGVTALAVELPRSVYSTAEERAFFDELLLLLEAAGSGIAMAALLPLGDARNYTDFEVTGAAADAPAVAVQEVTTDYFALLEIPIVAGRAFQPEDRSRGAIIVNQSLARSHWPNGNAVGQTVTIGDRPREIVGVVRNSQLHDVGRSEAMYFAPFAANSQGVGEPPVLLVPAPAAAATVTAIRAAEPNAIIETISLIEQAERSLGDAKGAARVASLLAWLALLLATSGVYGIISYSVERRRKEIMIRIALGARPREVVGLVLRRNAAPLVIGTALGLLVSAGEAIVLRSQLYGVSPLDPALLAGVSAILLLAGTAAGALPARRAIRTDPIVALHEQ